MVCYRERRIYSVFEYQVSNGSHYVDICNGKTNSVQKHKRSTAAVSYYGLALFQHLCFRNL